VDDLKQDEHPRPDVTVEKLSTMKPAFKPDGTITAGNSSGINDGAALLIVCDDEAASKYGFTPLATICGAANVGCEPSLMGLGPVHTTRKLCQKINADINALDTIEINEAFSAQVLACMKELALNDDRINPDGGGYCPGTSARNFRRPADRAPDSSNRAV